MSFPPHEQFGFGLARGETGRYVSILHNRAGGWVLRPKETGCPSKGGAMQRFTKPRRLAPRDALGIVAYIDLFPSAALFASSSFDCCRIWSKRAQEVIRL